MRSIPRVAKVRTMVSGLNTLPDDADVGVSTFGPSDSGRTPGASNSTVTWVGAST